MGGQREGIRNGGGGGAADLRGGRRIAVRRLHNAVVDFCGEIVGGGDGWGQYPSAGHYQAKFGNGHTGSRF